MLWLTSSFFSFLAILSLPCVKSVRYIAIYDRHLIGKALLSFPANFPDCIHRCNTTPNCTGLHLTKSDIKDLSDDSIKGDCYLFQKNDITGYEDDPFSRTYYLIKGKPYTCDIHPCVNGGICHNLSPPKYRWKGYQCECPCGWCGEKCEKLHYEQHKNMCRSKEDLGFHKVGHEEECAYACTKTKGCVAADYKISTRMCYLLSANVTIVCVTPDKDNILLYLDCSCEN